MKYPINHQHLLESFINRNIACIVSVLFLSSNLMGETYHFASHGGGSKKEEFLDFKVDAHENSYVLLKYDSNVTFGADTYTHPAKNTILVKYDRSGKQLMSKNIVAESTGRMFGAIGVSDDGTVVAAAGTKAGDLDGHAVYSGTFIGKLGVDGKFDWVMQPIDKIDRVRQFIEFRVTAIEVTEHDIYVAATADGRITLNGVTDPGYAHDNLQSALLIKMDYDGKILWIKQIPTPGVNNHPTIDSGLDHILPSADGQHIYVAGKVGDGSYNPYEVAFVAKFQTDGTFLWIKKTSSSGSDSWGIAETSNGDVITGFSVGGPQVIDFGDGAKLESSDTGWFGALARFDKNGMVKTLKYVSDALYSDVSNFGVGNLLRLRHLTVNQNDQAILVGEIVGTHLFNNGLSITTSSGLLGNSTDASLIICDLNFDPIEVYANTGGNNESGHKCATKGNRIYYSGIYDSYSHPFLGSHMPKFGDFTFESAGNQDIFVASVSVASLPSPNPVPRLEFTRQANSLTLSWPASEDINTILEFSPNLRIDTWDTLNISPTLENERWQITLPVNEESGFYRLINQE